jgi:hypothetical protein
MRCSTWSAPTVNSLTPDDPLATLVSGGVLTVNSGLIIDAGTLDIATGTVIATGTFDNAGTILDAGTLEEFGSYNAASLERIGGSGGALLLAGSLANTGGTLDGTGLGNLTILGIGTIKGGTVARVIPNPTRSGRCASRHTASDQTGRAATSVCRPTTPSMSATY